MTMKNAQQRAALYPLDVRTTRAMPFKDVQIRSKPNGTGGSTLTFEGYACVTEVGFDMYDMFGKFTEIVRHGAFAKTLSESADVAFLVNHEGVTLARTKSDTLTLGEDDTGLQANADLDGASPAVQVIQSAMERGDLDEMSFAFRVMRQTWSPDYDQRDIHEIDLNRGDVSVVNYGANPFTSGGLRSLAEVRAAHGRLARAAADQVEGIDLDAYMDALREVRAGKALSTSTMSTLQEVLDLIASADDDVDEAQVVLSDLMGVDNPDAPMSAALPLQLARAQWARELIGS